MGVRRLLLSVGAMKAGTTFMHRIFLRNRGVFFTPEKELHYFAHVNGLSKALQRPLILDLEPAEFAYHTHEPGTILSTRYRIHRLASVLRGRYAQISDADELRTIVQWYAERYLSDPVDENWFDRVFHGSGDLWAADFSNYNALLDEAGWRSVRAHCDELKVLYFLRDPVERAWSHIRFEQMLSGGRAAIMEGSPEVAEAFIRSPSSAHGRYADIVSSLRRNLSEDELRIVKFESFLADFPASMREIEDFLGLPPGDYADVNTGHKVNASAGAPMSEAIRDRLAGALAGQIASLREMGFASRD